MDGVSYGQRPCPHRSARSSPGRGAQGRPRVPPNPHTHLPSWGQVGSVAAGESVGMTHAVSTEMPLTRRCGLLGFPVCPSPPDGPSPGGSHVAARCQGQESDQSFQEEDPLCPFQTQVSKKRPLRGGCLMSDLIREQRKEIRCFVQDIGQN